MQPDVPPVPSNLPSFSPGPVPTPTMPNVVSSTNKGPSSKKIITIALIVLTLIGGIATAIFLVQRQQRIATQAWDCTKYNFSVSITGLVTVSNLSDRNEPEQKVAITINGVHAGTFDVPALEPDQTATVGTVEVPNTGFTWEAIGTKDCKDTGLYPGVPTATPTKPSVPACPAQTELLFPNSGSLSVGSNVGGNGTVSSMNGSWSVNLRDGQLMAESGSKITVKFPETVLLDTVLIYDNDPKTGENPWSIDGVSLPTTNNNEWGPAFKINIKSNELVFDNGGDSPHFNVCLIQLEAPTVTPTKSIDPSVTPTTPVDPSVTPTTTIASSPTPTTVAATGTPNSCNGTCGSDINCQSGLVCYSGFCRNPNNPTDTNCNNKGNPNACGGTCGSDINCKSGLVCYGGICRNPSNPTSPTCSTTTTSSTVTPTPITQLPQSGSESSTWLLGLGGLLILGLGGLLLIL